MTFSRLDLNSAKDQYAKAEPFPFCVIDDFLQPEVAELVHTDLAYLIPTREWNHYDNPLEKKYTTERWELMPDVTRTLISILNTSIMTDMLEHITGISNLVGDPGLRGAGISLVLPGGKLDLHADRQIHPKLGLCRRLNALIYFNKEWKDSYGGHLEFWDKDVKTCVHKIAPIFNRMVLFETSKYSFHGHPDPLTAPIGMARKTISLYYWANSVPKGFEINEGSTDFRPRPWEAINSAEEAFRQKRRTESPKK